MLYAEEPVGETRLRQKRLKVLMLADAGSFHTARYLAELRRQKCCVLLLSLEDGPVRHLRLKSHGPLRTLHYVLAVPQIRKIISRFTPDIINPHFASGYGFIAALAIIGRKLPLVCHVWGSDILLVPRKSRLHKYKTAFALKHADAIVGDSRYIISQAQKLASLKHQEIYPWGIEQEYLALHKRDYQFGNPVRVIIPRMQEPVYNNLFIVKALAPLVNTGKIRLTFPAFGSQAASFMRFASALVGDGIEFYEKMPRLEFLRFMNKHDIYLSASRSDSSPVSLIEAMALGLVPIGADIEGVRERLTPESGFLFIQDDEPSLSQAVSNVVDSGSLRESMRRRNLERVKREAVFEENIAAQIDLMKRLVTGRRASS